MPACACVRVRDLVFEGLDSVAQLLSAALRVVSEPAPPPANDMQSACTPPPANPRSLCAPAPTLAPANPTQ
eukprot:3826647-Rhodomonas_salina.1